MVWLGIGHGRQWALGPPPVSHFLSLSLSLFFFAGPESGVNHSTTLESSADLFGPLVTMELLHTLLQDYGSVCCRYFAVPASEPFFFFCPFIGTCW